jgi:hypothetical protein
MTPNPYTVKNITKSGERKCRKWLIFEINRASMPENWLGGRLSENSILQIAS